MCKPRHLLITAAALSFDMSLFQAGLAFSPRWSAAYGGPPQLVANPPLLLAAGILMSFAFMVFGLYGLSGAGVIRRLPLLRLGLLGIGSGYFLMGSSFIPQALVLAHVLPATQPIMLHLVAFTFIALVTGLLYLVGLAIGWKSLGTRAAGGGKARRGDRVERIEAARI